MLKKGEKDLATLDFIKETNDKAARPGEVHLRTSLTTVHHTTNAEFQVSRPNTEVKKPPQQQQICAVLANVPNYVLDGGRE